MNKDENYISLLNELLALISDESAIQDFSNTFYNRKHHAKALLRNVYNDWRYFQKNEYAEVIYHENYSKEVLKSRPFINFGPGNFRHKYWTIADKIYHANNGKLWSESRGNSFHEKIDYEFDLYKQQPINIDDGTYEIAYASHIVEHAYDEDNKYFFKEVYRILRKGGIFRVTAPNIDLGLRAARNKDYSFYGQYYFQKGGHFREQVLGKIERRKPIEWFVLENCSLLVNSENSTFLEPSQCADFLWSNKDIYKTLNKASSLSDRSLNEKLAVHVNWFNPEKICRMLKGAGFSKILISSYGQSISPILRDIRYFDNTNPLVSWYVDAIK